MKLFLDAFRQVGVYTARVLKGTKPADLPCSRPNSSWARAIGARHHAPCSRRCFVRPSWTEPSVHTHASHPARPDGSAATVARPLIEKFLNERTPRLAGGATSRRQ